ncbi:hypothetical protein PoB_002107700 [Plakobranchus ocellatus]|uniref:Uncharacterized protein n=1 Tax=Plakobranchus ocellatus TaxID=259542 RepID=A0AAV3ZJ56_9GAST|nr:hypothetical protein PoB_002107700 [Plakobranchus ocellatus]
MINIHKYIFSGVGSETPGATPSNLHSIGSGPEAVGGWLEPDPCRVSGRFARFGATAYVLNSMPVSLPDLCVSIQRQTVTERRRGPCANSPGREISVFTGVKLPSSGQ